MAGDAKRAVENSSNVVGDVKVKGRKGHFLILKEDIKTLDLISLDEETPVCLLPKFDSILLGHKDRTRIVRDEYKKRVFKPKVGDIAATMFINGQVVGTWRQKKSKSTLMVIIAPFVKIGKEALQGVEERAEELSQFMGFSKFKVSIAHS